MLHAREVSTQSTASAISGTIIDGSTQQPVIGGNTIVALEQKNSAGVDRVVMETVTTSSGGFSFCPVPQGTYDAVAVASDGSGNRYAPTVITGVQPGNSLGTVPLTPASLPAWISGQVTTSTGSTGAAADLVVSALQSIGNSVLITVPLAQQSAATATLATAPDVACPNVDCANYTLAVPAASPAIGTLSSAGNQLPAAPASGLVNYTIDVNAFVPGSAGQGDCSPSNMQTTLSVNTGTPVTAATLPFVGCQ